MLQRRLIRVDGTTVDLDGRQSMDAVRTLIQADSLDSVELRHLGQPRMVMLVDDTGFVDGKPMNREASQLYWANCHPGTTHPICGDVVVVPDQDYA